MDLTTGSDDKYEQNEHNENDEDTDEEPVQPLRRSSRSSLNNGKHLLFDRKFHPMDEYTRPAHAAKRRRLHLISDSDDERETCNDYNDDESDSESQDSKSDKENQADSPYIAPKSLRIKEPWRRERREGSRQSDRLSAAFLPSYDELVHPQDDNLIEARLFKRLANGKVVETEPTSDTNSDSSEDESVEGEGTTSEPRLMERFTNDIESSILRYTQAWETLITPEATADRESHHINNVVPEREILFQEQDDGSPSQEEIHTTGQNLMNEVEANDLSSSLALQNEVIHRPASHQEYPLAPLGYGRIKIELSDPAAPSEKFPNTESRVSTESPSSQNTNEAERTSSVASGSSSPLCTASISSH